MQLKEKNRGKNMVPIRKAREVENCILTWILAYDDCMHCIIITPPSREVGHHLNCYLSYKTFFVLE